MPNFSGRPNQNWKALTADDTILTIVKVCVIDLHDTPYQVNLRSNMVHSEIEVQIIDQELSKLLIKGVIRLTTDEQGEFISPIFVRPKKDGTHILILNLKDFNKHVTYHHFEMESLKSSINLMTEGCYMAPVDLRDAYYSVPVAERYQK